MTALAAALFFAAVPSSPAQEVRVLGRGLARVRAVRPITWPSRAGDVHVSVSVVEHSVTLHVANDHAPGRRHTFDANYWGEPLYADYGTWNDGALDIRLFERPPSLGWPRFTACARVEVREGVPVIVDTQSPAEWGCAGE